MNPTLYTGRFWLACAIHFTGAMSFGMGGLYLGYVNLLPILFCAAWLPLTCLYVRRFLFTRAARGRWGRTGHRVEKLA